MSALPERRPAIDIEEFERRLRAPADPTPEQNDPLAELARLVAGRGKPAVDPFASLFGARDGAASPKPLQRDETNFAPQRVDTNFAPQRVEPTLAPPVAFNLDRADQGLRGSFRGDSHDARPHAAREQHIDSFDLPVEPRAGAVAPSPLSSIDAPGQYQPSSEFENWGEEADIAPDALEPAAPRARSKKPLILAGGVILVGFAAIAGTLAWRGGSPTSREVATISAASGPVKVQAKNTDSADSPSRDATMLDKTATTPPVRKVVTRDEQPIDVNAASKSPRMISMADDGQKSAAMGTTGAAAVPTPMPPVRSVSQGNSAFPEPKKVKTVAVRPDGSIISSESSTVTAPQPPVRPAAPAATPAAKNATPKSAARVAPVATPAAAKPVAQKPPVAVKPAPKQVAAVQPQDDSEADTATDAALARPGKTATAGGAFAVQLAAPGSEAEARQTAQRLGEKYSGALGGRRPSVQKASDKAVYRVRIGGLSREGATDMCDKIKAAGGACFVAR